MFKYFLFLIIIILIYLFLSLFIKFVIVYRKSELIKKLRKLNKNYKFNNHVKPNQKIKYFISDCDLIKKGKLDDIFKGIFLDNFNNSFVNFNNVKFNDDLYSDYIKEYKKLNSKTKAKILGKSGLSEKNFYKIEKILFKIKKLNPIVSVKIKFILIYNDLNGKKFKKSKNFLYNDIKNL